MKRNVEIKSKIGMAKANLASKAEYWDPVTNFKVLYVLGIVI